MFGRRRQKSSSVESAAQPVVAEVDTKEWDEVEAWLFRTVSGVYHTDPTNGDDAVFNMFFIETDNEGQGVMVTPDTAAGEMKKLREVFGEQYPHIFEAAIPTQEG